MQVLFCGVRCCSNVTYGTIACRQVSRPVADECVGRLCQTISFYHKVLIYREHHSVCPLVGTGTPPTLLPQASVPSSQVGGGHTRLWLRGWGSPNSDDWRKNLALYLLCDTITLLGTYIDKYLLESL